MKEQYYLFSLHRSDKEFRIVAATIAKTPEEATAIFGGTLKARKDGICTSSSDLYELDLCGEIIFPPEIFRELEDDDIYLAGVFLEDNTLAYTHNGVNLLTREGKSIKLTLRRQQIHIPKSLFQ